VNHFKPRPGQTPVSVTPETAPWTYLSFAVHRLEAGEMFSGESGSLELALVLIAGTATVQVGSHEFQLSRRGVFLEMPHVLYLPPGSRLTVHAESTLEFSLGGAPAEGRYPLRLLHPREMRSELRGGANATRRVNHILGADLPAERLLLYEVYTPSGFWSGWPPHRHDGHHGSLYIEETYYYKIQPSSGWAIHRNYSPEDDLDELLLARNGDLILAPKGYHPVAAPPGSNVYYLNYMAGEALNEARATPPVDDPDWAWMRQNWAGEPFDLETVHAPARGEESS
jgi:5-deoxy-glucuronate isomerase